MLVSDLFQFFPDLVIANYTCDNTLHSTKKIERAISMFRGRDKCFIKLFTKYLLYANPEKSHCSMNTAGEI